MNITRKLLPSRMLIIYSIIISAIVGYAIYYAFTEGNTLIRIVVIIATLLIVLPVLRMPVSINEDNDTIRIKLIVGEIVFLKKISTTFNGSIFIKAFRYYMDYLFL